MLDLGIELGAGENDDNGQPHPGHKADDCATKNALPSNRDWLS
jgi:hypothetical protein